ncbi:hypothetical protein BDF22DRAFT_662488 [Syncephalis plumigaleata]|nr:hypothetical protein BDF22DRAFT_662488 [Syncephalis plumigaleata]
MSASYELASVSDTMPRGTGNGSIRERTRAVGDYSDDDNDITAMHRNPFATSSLTPKGSQPKSSKRSLDSSTGNTRRIALKARERQKMMFGFMLLAIGLILTTIQTEITAVLQSRKNYKKPYFILWWAHSMFIFLWPVIAFIEYLGAGNLTRFKRRVGRGAAYLKSSVIERRRTDPIHMHEHKTNIHDDDHDDHDEDDINEDDPIHDVAMASNWSWKPMIQQALWMSPVFNGSSYGWYLAAGMTSAAALTAISNTSCCFVYLFSVLLLGDPIRARMIAAVIISVAGVVFMAVSDGMTAPLEHPLPSIVQNGTAIAATNATDTVATTATLASAIAIATATATSSIIAATVNSTATTVASNVLVSSHNDIVSLPPPPPDASHHSGSFLGDIVSLLTAVFNGLYQVLYKHHVVPSRHNSVLFAQTTLAMMGVFTLTVCWIPLPILHWIGWEPFELPDLETFGFMCSIGLLSATSNACFLPIIALISPLFVSVGSMLIIPMVAITDWFVQGKAITFGLAMGSIGICIGFIMLTVGGDGKDDTPITTGNANYNRIDQLADKHDAVESEAIPMLEPAAIHDTRHDPLIASQKHDSQWTWNDWNEGTEADDDRVSSPNMSTRQVNQHHKHTIRDP